jgi:rRNA maturation endonuclease Nob1
MSLLSKVTFDKQTTTLDLKEEAYYMHMLQGDRLIGDYIRSQMRLNPHMRRDIFHQPVCAKCEKFAFHHKDGVMCPSCGHWSPTKTHKVIEHIRGGHYK